MQTIDHNSLLRLVRKATWITGLFPEKAPTYSQSGFQLSLGRDVPIKAAGRKVGTRTEYHVISFDRGGRAATPETFAHWSYGEADAIKILLVAEIQAAKKQGRDPQIDVGPTRWGSESHSVVAAVPGAGAPKFIYTVHFRCADLWIVTYGSVERADRFGPKKWHPADAPDENELKHAITRYRFGEPSAELKAV